MKPLTVKSLSFPEANNNELVLQEIKMSKDYSKKLLKYMKEVYHIEDAIKQLKDRRTT
jgi:hypothetical protein